MATANGLRELSSKLVCHSLALGVSSAGKSLRWSHDTATAWKSAEELMRSLGAFLGDLFCRVSLYRHQQYGYIQVCLFLARLQACCLVALDVSLV